MRILCVKVPVRIASLIEAEAKRRGMNISTYIKYALYYFTLTSIAERYESASATSTSGVYVNDPDDYEKYGYNEQYDES